MPLVRAGIPALRACTPPVCQNAWLHSALPAHAGCSKALPWENAVTAEEAVKVLGARPLHGRRRVACVG